MNLAFILSAFTLSWVFFFSGVTARAMAWSPKPPWARSPGGGGGSGGGGGGANRGEKSWTSRQNFGWYFSIPAYFRAQRGSFQYLKEEFQIRVGTTWPLQPTKIFQKAFDNKVS